MNENAKTLPELVYKVVLIRMTFERPEKQNQKTRITEAWIPGG
jgi:hypothetical protein